jgi:pimeloyl-ACP methyl ester carboxylesterase
LFEEGVSRWATSADGTDIALQAVTDPTGAFDIQQRLAHPPVLLVHGATADHTTWRVVGPMLAATRLVDVIDRRGRGESGDTLPYSIEREFEDVAAAADMIEESFGLGVDVVGHS